MKQIAIYLRLSLADHDLGFDGKEESNSIENQRLLIRNYLESREDLIGDIVEYKDDGYSGLNFDRPAFRQMIEDAKHGLIGTIVVKDLSRFGRDYIGVGDYMEQILPSLGVRLIAISSKYDSQEQGENILSLDVSIGNMINNMYSKDLSKKLRSSFRTKWNAGQNPSGGAPFGYYLEDGDKTKKLHIDEEVAPIVRLIFELAVQGFDTKEISERLNSLGCITPIMYKVQKGKSTFNIDTSKEEQLWSTSRVRVIIRNYDYTGARVHGKKECCEIGAKIYRKVPETARVIVENDHEPLVSKEDFKLAQLVIHRKKESSYWNKNGDAFSRKLKCACCGATLQLWTGTPVGLYCQHSQAIGSKSKCNKDKMDRNVIVSRVWYAIKKHVELLSSLKEAYSAMSEKENMDSDEQVVCSEQELQRLSDELARDYENYVNGHLDREQFIEKKNIINQKKRELEATLSKIESDKSSSDRLLMDLTQKVKVGQAFKTKGKVTDEAVDVFLDKVIVHSQNNIEVILKTEDLFKNVINELAKNESALTTG